MKASLVFSPIEHADVTLLLRTLNLNNSSRLEIQEDLTIKNRLVRLEFILILLFINRNSILYTRPIIIMMIVH